MDNTGMSTAETETAGIDPQVLADLNAVMKRIIDGTPVDLETSRRIEERADRITEELRRTRGVMDDDRFQGLLRDDDVGSTCSTPPSRSAG
jgi:hypothetical protein